jgi:hypothetical protein
MDDDEDAVFDSAGEEDEEKKEKREKKPKQTKRPNA